MRPALVPTSCGPPGRRLLAAPFVQELKYECPGRVRARCYARGDDQSVWRCHLVCGLVAEGHDENQLLRMSVPSGDDSQAVWLYLRFTLSLRDVEDLLAERGIVISYETLRRWVNHFGPIITAELRKRRPKPHAV
jgi:hypothetical protein